MDEVTSRILMILVDQIGKSSHAEDWTEEFAQLWRDQQAFKHGETPNIPVNIPIKKIQEND